MNKSNKRKVVLTIVGIGIVVACICICNLVKTKQYNDKYKWSEGLSEQATKAKEASNSFVEIARLQKEVSDIKLTIQSKDSSTEDLTNAKNRLQEISDYLNQEYGLEVQADTGQLDDALSKLKEKKHSEAQENQDALGDALRGAKDKYEESKAEIDKFKEDYENSVKQ